MSRSIKKTPILKFGQCVTKSQANKKLRRANRVILKDIDYEWEEYGIYSPVHAKEFKLKREVVNTWDIYDHRWFFKEKDMRARCNWYGKEYTEEDIAKRKRIYCNK